MHAYLITGQGPAKIDEKIAEVANSLGAKTVGFELKKITDVKSLLKFTTLGLSEKTAIVIKDIDSASIDTQNAFLKSLEEPQEKLSYILTAKSQDSLLPTIISRCQVVEVKSPKARLDSAEEKKICDFITASIGQKLKTTAGITKREDALEFVSTLIVVLESKLADNPAIAGSLEKTLETLVRIKANGNVQLQLTNLVISLKSVHI